MSAKSKSARPGSTRAGLSSADNTGKTSGRSARAKSKGSGKNRSQSNKLADTVRKSVAQYLEDLNGEEASGVYDMVLSEVEKPLLYVVMRYAEDNQSKASRILGINRNTLRKKLAQYELGSSK